jgi:2-haloacid dehalogenase
VKRYRNAVLFDVVGTLVHLTPLEERLGGTAQADAWFERLLHSATSLTLAGEWQPFAELAESTLRTALARIHVDVDSDELLAELERLPAYPDARPAVALLVEAGVSVGTLTNGGERATRKLLEAAGLEEQIEEVISAEELELYKPHGALYKHAAERIGAEPRNTTLIAAHAWDVVGAKAAGLEAIWVERAEREWPFAKGKPRRSASNLEQAAQLALERTR